MLNINMCFNRKQDSIFVSQDNISLKSKTKKLGHSWNSNNAQKDGQKCTFKKLPGNQKNSQVQCIDSFDISWSWIFKENLLLHQENSY